MISLFQYFPTSMHLFDRSYFPIEKLTFGIFRKITKPEAYKSLNTQGKID